MGFVLSSWLILQKKVRSSKKSSSSARTARRTPPPPLALRCRSNGGGLQAKQAPDMGFLKRKRTILFVFWTEEAQNGAQMQELLAASHAAPTGKATLSLPLFDRNSTLYRPRTRLPCAMDPLASRSPCNHHTEVGLEAKSWSSLVWCAKFGVLRARRYEVQIPSLSWSISSPPRLQGPRAVPFLEARCGRAEGARPDPQGSLEPRP